jgi:hypothetical protein
VSTTNRFARLRAWRAGAVPERLLAVALLLGLIVEAGHIYGWFRPLPGAERLLTIGVLAIGIAQIIVSRPHPPGTAAASPPSARSARTTPP